MGLLACPQEMHVLMAPTIGTHGFIAPQLCYAAMEILNSQRIVKQKVI